DEAVAIAAARQPAGIVMDVLMPRMDGYTALTRLRGDARTRAIPVVMLTAQPDQIYQSLSAGVGGGRPSDEALHREAIDSAGRGSDASGLGRCRRWERRRPDAGLTPVSADH